ncbi:MAG: 6-bladed beta-propeller [Acidobacteriota bacterium]|nr:6-bladed beta-propeller [Acidobacteriota bacterium]
MFLLFGLLWMLDGNTNVEVVKEFENPEDVSEDYLNFPYSFDMSQDGRLYVIDRWRHRLMIWNNDGSFNTGVGSKGKGPGEIYFPMKVAVDDKHVYVWEPLRRLTLFDLDGKYIKNINIPKIQPRVFGVLKPNLFLMGTQVPTQKGMFYVIGTQDDQGKTVEQLGQWKNEAVIKMEKTGIESAIFGPDIDIQRDDKGNWHFGCSAEPFLYQVGKDGKVSGKKRFEIPAGPPTDDEVTLATTMTFPKHDGSRIDFSKMKGMKLVTDRDKSFYTHFMVKGDKALFVQTPLGGHVGMGNGFSQAVYYVNDFNTGKVLSRGTYEFAEDTQILYRNGRILGLVVNEDDEIDVRELKLKEF